MPNITTKEMIEQILNKIIEKSEVQDLREYLLYPEILAQRVRAEVRSRLNDEGVEIESGITEQVSRLQAEENGQDIEGFSEHFSVVLEASLEVQEELYKERKKAVKLELERELPFVHTLFVAKLKSSQEARAASGISTYDTTALNKSLALMEEYENLNKLYAILAQELELKQNKLKIAEDFLKPIDEKRRLKLAREQDFSKENRTLKKDIADLRSANNRVEKLLGESIEDLLIWGAFLLISIASTIAFFVLLSTVIGPVLFVYAAVGLAFASIATGLSLVETLFCLDDVFEYYAKKEVNAELIQGKQIHMEQNQEALYRLEMEGLMSSPMDSLIESRVQALIKGYQENIALLEDQLTALGGELEFTDAGLEYLHSQEGSEAPLRVYFATHSFFGGAERVVEQTPEVASDLSLAG